MRIERTDNQVTVSIDDNDVGRHIRSNKDPLNKLHWLRDVMGSLTHEEVQRVREFMTGSPANQGEDEPHVQYLAWIDRILDEAAPLWAAMDEASRKARESSVSSFFRD